MYEKVEVTIRGKQVEIFKFGAVEGWKIMRKIMAVVGPTMTTLSKSDGEPDEDMLSKAVSLFFDRLSEKELIQLLKSLTSSCTIDGAKVIFDRDIGVNGFTIELVKAVLGANFEEFFTEVQGLMADSLDENNKKEVTPIKA